MKKTGRVYKRMIITYVLVLCIPILLSVVLYQYTHNTMQNQAQEQSEDLLKTIKSACDREISYYKNVLQQLKADDEVKQLTNSKTLGDGERRWLAIQIAGTVNDFRDAMLDYSVFCADLFIYFIDEDVLISSFGGKTDFDRYCDFWMEMGQDEKEWFRQQLALVEKEELAMGQLKGQESILMLDRMLSRTGKKQNVVLGSWIIPELFEKQIGSAEWEGKREWAFIDSDGEYLHLTEALKVEGLDKSDITSGKIIIGKERYHVRSLKSDVYDGEYLLFSSVRRTTQAASGVRNVYLLCMAASVLLGYMVMKASMKKNYVPLERLINILPKSEGEMTRDEFQYLEKRMLGMMEQYNDVNESVAKHKKAVQEAAFQKLLIPAGAKGREIETETKELFEKFKRGVNVVLMFCIRDGILGDEKNGATEMDHSLKRFVVANVLSEGVGETFTQETIEYEDRVVMIVNLPEGDSDELLRSACDKYCGFVEENFKFQINTFVGNGYKGIKGIHYSYLEACQAESFGMDSDENYICYSEISDCTSRSYQYSFEAEEMVINAIRDKNGSLASSLINKVLENNFDNPDRTLWQCMMYDIYTTLMKVSEEMEIGIHKMPSISEAFTMTTLQELQDWFYEVIEKICAKEQEKSSEDRGKEKDREEFYREILVYIRENFKNPDLNVSQIALKFQMTPVYMSAIFKRQAGKSILDVIRQLRLEHARKLLEEGMSVYDVSAEVGFRDSTAFGRAFKSYYGVTPGKVKKRT